MSDQIITIVPLGKVTDSILKYIGKSLEGAFNLRTRILPWKSISSKILPPLYGDRYNSTRILNYLSERLPKDTFKLLAIASMERRNWGGFVHWCLCFV